MRLRLLKIVKFTAITLVGLVVVSVAVGLGLRAYYQHLNAPKLVIRTPNGIDEGMYVTIGGIEQWVQIRGQDRENPVLLYLHGGPGGSTLAATLGWLPWEKYFTVVQWDQRGAGRTYQKNGRSEADAMTIDRMVEDGVEVTEFLRSHLHKDKIVLVGHSWGSILGIHMVKEHPELFAAYVGTGQVVNMQRNEELNYAHVLAQAHATQNNTALATLAEIGPPPYDNIVKIGIERKWADELGSSSGDNVKPRLNVTMPGISLADIYYLFSGANFSQELLFGEHFSGPVTHVDLPSLGLDFSVPIFFFEGTQDQQTPIELAQEYFDEIKAPHKEFVRFEGDHHFVAINRPDEFLQELVGRVRPWVGSSN